MTSFKSHLTESAKPKHRPVAQKRKWSVQLKGKGKMTVDARTPADALKMAMRKAKLSFDNDMDKVEAVMLAESNLEEAVDTGRGVVQHATVSFDEIDGMIISLNNGYDVLDITKAEMRKVMKGQTVKRVPYLKN